MDNPTRATTQSRQDRIRPRIAICAMLLLPGLTGLAGPAIARPEIGAVCDIAADRAARETGVPLAVLQAITRTETGRTRHGTVEPWPWTVNMQGKGVWFETEDSARAYVFEHFKAGARSFDVGCFQINYRWHGDAFQSIEQMFDPLENARYAARFLADLYRESGSWSDAAGAYHSRTPEFAARYRKRFDRIHATIGPDGPAPGPSPATRPEPDAARSVTMANTYPLLQPGSHQLALGSLVPLSAPGGRGIFAHPEG